MFPKNDVVGYWAAHSFAQKQDYTNKQQSWHNNIIQHLNKHRVGNNLHVWMVRVLPEQSKAISFTFMVKRSGNIFYFFNI